MLLCRASSRGGGKMGTGNLGQGTGDREVGAGTGGSKLGTFVAMRRESVAATAARGDRVDRGECMPRIVICWMFFGMFW